MKAIDKIVAFLLAGILLGGSVLHGGVWLSEVLSSGAHTVVLRGNGRFTVDSVASGADNADLCSTGKRKPASAFFFHKSGLDFGSILCYSKNGKENLPGRWRQ